MIASLKGEVSLIRKDRIVVDCHDIGFEVFVSHPESFPLSEKIFLYTWMQNREEGPCLFGFRELVEYDLFLLLIKIKGVGPKTAMNMLGAMPAQDMIRAIDAGDVKALKSLPGIGAKTASQIILDMKGTVVLLSEEGTKEEKTQAAANPAWEETREALEALGYKPSAYAFLEEEMAGRKDLKADQMLRQCLGRLAISSGF